MNYDKEHILDRELYNLPVSISISFKFEWADFYIICIGSRKCVWSCGRRSGWGIRALPCKKKREKNKGEILFRWDVRCFAAPQFIFRASPTLKKTIWASHLTKEAAVVIFLFYFIFFTNKDGFNFIGDNTWAACSVSVWRGPSSSIHKQREPELYVRIRTF